jgi:hypothetical protein
MGQTSKRESEALDTPVYVVFRSIEETAAAMRIGGDLAKRLGVRLVVIHLPTADLQRDFSRAARPHSLIVIAGRRSWWPTRTERWRRSLEAAGHFVVFVDTTVFADTTAFADAAEHKESVCA